MSATIIEINIETVDRTNGTLEKTNRELEKMEKNVSKATNKVKDGFSGAGERVSRFQQQSDKAQSGLKKWMSEKYELLLEAKDRISPILERLKPGLKSIAGKAWSVTLKAVDLATAPLRGLFNLLKNPIFQVGAVLGVSVGIKDTVDTFANFEAAMSQVKAVSGANEEQLGALTEKAKEMGATTKFTAAESAEAFNYMAMAGWKTEDMMNGIEGILSLAAASGESLGTTSDIVTDALTAMGLKASDSGHFADVLAQASSNANTNVGLMGETFKYVGAMAGSLGYSIEDVSLAVGLMANSGLKGSMAGTSLNSIMTRLATNTRGARDAIEKLGVEFYNQDGSARSLKVVMDELRVATGEMTDKQKSNLAKTVAGVEAQKGLLAILNAETKDYEKLTEAVNNADGAAARMSDTMMDNLAGALTLLQSAADGVKIAFGERLKPYIKGLAVWLTDLMPDIERSLDRFMDYVDQMVDHTKLRIEGMTNTVEWKNADLFGKITIAWDTIILQPFSEWWQSSGKEKFAGFAGKIGEGIGTGINIGIMTLLGINPGNIFDDGTSIGVSFASGFLEGLKGMDILGAITSNFGSFATNPLGALLIGRGIFGAAKGLRTLFPPVSAGPGPVPVPPAGPAPAAGLGISASAVASVTGAVFALLGIKSGVDNLKRAGGLRYDVIEKTKEARTGMTKLGMVGAGAAAGAAIGSIIPVGGTLVGGLVGAGIGGLGAIFGGDTLSRWIGELTNAKDIQFETLLEMGHNLKQAADEYENITSTSDYARGLIDEYKKIEEAMNSGDLSKTELEAAQERLIEIGGLLQQVCPDLLTTYDVLNGKVSDRIGLLEKQFDYEDKQARRHFEQAYGEMMDNAPALQAQLPELQMQYDNLDADYDKLREYQDKIREIKQEFDELKNNGDEGWENTEQLNGLMKQAQEITQKYGFGYGLDDGFGESYEQIGDDLQSMMEEADSVKAKMDEVQQSLKATYDASITKMAMDQGINTEEFMAQIEQYNQLADAAAELALSGGLSKETMEGLKDILPEIENLNSQEAYAAIAEEMGNMSKDAEGAVQKIKDLNEKIKEVPEELKVKIKIITEGDITGFGINSSNLTDPSRLQKNARLKKYATGGILTRPHYGLVAEDGAEAIIPLNSKRRSRAIDLWRQTGDMLGIRAYANGGLIGAIPNDYQSIADTSGPSPMGALLPSWSNEAAGQNTPASNNANISVSVPTTVQVTVGGGMSESEITSILNRNMAGVADNLGEVIAAKLAAVYSNSPIIK